MFHSTPTSSKAKRRRDNEEERELESVASAIVTDDQDVELNFSLECTGGSSGFDYSNLTFSDSNDCSEFSFITPAPTDSIRKKLFENEELNERRDLFEDGILSDLEQTNDEDSPLSGTVSKAKHKIAFLKKMDAYQCSEEEEDGCGEVSTEMRVDVSDLVEMTGTGFSLSEDLLNNNGEYAENSGVSDEEDL